MGAIIGLLIIIATLSFVVYKLYILFSPTHRAQRRKEKDERKRLKFIEAQEEGTCYACGRVTLKGKMKKYKIIINEEHLGTHTENILGGLGGSKQVTTKRITYIDGWICKKCDNNLDLACLIWLLIMAVGEAITILIYKIAFKADIDTLIRCLFWGTIISYFVARYCWRTFRKRKHCDIKILND